ncbi:TPA: hypothetical protein PTX05_002365 [Cronobacter sakazakii]|nr:hypothetical protein [Cronobacter sakazakii]
MKLIDLLVQELPKRGGWPDGAVECERYLHEAQIDFYDKDGNWGADCGKVYGHDFAAACVKPREKGDGVRIERVTRERYEAALAAAQQPVWDGDGLPPVGCECERSWTGDKWLKCKILFISNETAVVKLATGEAAYHLSDITFRPIRSEADKRRDEAIAALKKLKPQLVGELAGYLYDEIAAGKIPHIRIEQAA